MKVGCKFCGIHFAHDFEKTLESPCNFWGDAGLANISPEDKKKLWDWCFSFPSDEFFVKYKVGLGFKWSAQPLVERLKWENIVTNWKDMTEEEKQEFQRNYFAGKFPDTGLPIVYGGNDAKTN